MLYMNMSNIKQVAVILVGLFVAMLLIGFFVGSAINLLVPPSEARFGDEVVEDIGGDKMLTAKLNGCVKVGEENIPDGTFKTNLGQNLGWKNAKNISYVDTSGNKGYMIVWKDSPDNYGSISGNNGVSYISDYLTSMNGLCFLVHYPEKNAVYGIILSTDEITYTEAKLLYTILDLDKNEFTSTYSQTSSTSSPSYSSGGSSHYHTVVPDRYTLSRTDPGAYYDHYEYGDNYEIDDYLESEGYD